MSGKLISILFLLISLIFYGVGEYYSKVWSIKPSWILGIFSVALYAASSALWLPALREHGQLSALSVVWSCLSIIICSMIGVMLFGEHLSTRQFLGIVLALIATILTF